MILYPGIAPLTVASSGGGAGVVVTSGSGDAHGWWPGPLVAEGNDPRSAANLMAAVEAVTDRVNWIGWREIDWIYGGSYETLFRAAVSIGTSLRIDRAWASDTTPALLVYGPTGADAYALDVYGSTSTGRAARFTAAASGVDCVEILGGSTSGTGLRVQARGGDSTAIDAIGHGSSPGLKATAGGTAGAPAVLVHSGPVQFDTDAADPLINGNLYRSNVPKAWVTFTLTGGNGAGAGSGVMSIHDSFNIDAAATVITGTPSVVQINLKRALGSAFWVPNFCVIASGGTVTYHPPNIISMTSSVITFKLYNAAGTLMDWDVTANVVTITMMAMGN